MDFQCGSIGPFTSVWMYVNFTFERNEQNWCLSLFWLHGCKWFLVVWFCTWFWGMKTISFCKIFTLLGHVAVTKCEISHAVMERWTNWWKTVCSIRVDFRSLHFESGKFCMRSFVADHIDSCPAIIIYNCCDTSKCTSVTKLLKKPHVVME